MATTTRIERPAPQIADLPAGTLVVTRPLPQLDCIPARTGVVVEAWGPDETATVLVWFWALGAPESSRSIHILFPVEIYTLDVTLDAMPEGAFRSIERKLAAYGDTLADALAPVAEAVAAARAERDRRR